MHRAGELRKESTPAERKLWAYLRGDKLQGVNFRRQHAIGNYIPDFCSIEKKLVIELDGSQHLQQEEYDNTRTQWLESQGYRVIRFWNGDIMKDINGVILAIIQALESPPISDAPQSATGSVPEEQSPPISDAPQSAIGGDVQRTEGAG